jgi:hypothetical protein
MKKNIFTSSDQINENYATRIIKVDNVRPHPNPDVTRLDIVTINGSDIIVGRNQVNIGDIVVYCPCESALNLDFLRANDQFRDYTMNISQDEQKTGFFENKGRVKAINIQKIISTGFIFPPEWFTNWIKGLDLKNIEDYVNIPFDTINSELFSKKYIIIDRRQHSSQTSKKVKRNNKLKRFDKLIENQFSFHYDTKKFSDNYFYVNPDDIISITSKFHGTSVIISNILINKDLKYFEKIFKKLNVNICTQEYGYLYSSRGVIKNRYVNKGVTHGFYGVDVWTMAGERLKEYLKPGLSIYGEIVGYLPGSDKCIQKKHDYKCKPGEFEVYIYRLTYTNVNGDVFEFSAKQVQNWCKERALKPVKELYYGKAKDLYPDLSTELHWHQNFIERLSNDKERFYMEVNSPDCFNKVPHEGIVIRNDSNGYPAVKVKTKAHYLMETKELDDGIIDIETIEEVPNE